MVRINFVAAAKRDTSEKSIKVMVKTDSSDVMTVGDVIGKTLYGIEVLGASFTTSEIYDKVMTNVIEKLNDDDWGSPIFKTVYRTECLHITMTVD